MSIKKEEVVLHICCGPCATHTLKVLKVDYNIIGYFYNPNIHPKKEYEKRMNNVIKLLDYEDFDLFFGDYEIDKWYKDIEGLENEKEGGKRCFVCIKHRLEKTAKFAVKKGVKFFTSTLSISPYKNTKMINKIGEELAEKYDLIFLPENFKSKDGYKKSIDLSKKYNLYRQKYCGCDFSLKERKKYLKNKENENV